MDIVQNNLSLFTAVFALTLWSQVGMTIESQYL